MNEQTLIDILSARFQPHTILLYGSRARGDATFYSDWDVVCVADVAEERHEGWLEGDAFVDAFVYPALEPNEDALRILGARVLRDERGLAEPFLAALGAVHARGPKPRPPHQVAMEKAWILKMLARVRRGLGDSSDLEASYRRHWLMKDLLECAFTFRSEWYEGPKAGLATLKDKDPALWALFAAALPAEAEFASVERLVHAVHDL